jgi:hypothetical protein
VIHSEPQLALKIYALNLPRVDDGTAVQWTTVRPGPLFALQHMRPAQGRGGSPVWRITPVAWTASSAPPSTGCGALFRDSIVFEEIYRFNWECIYWFDAEAFDNAMDRVGQSADRGRKIAALEEALALYQGDYLEGIYSDWCTLERERLREQYLAALGTLAGLCADQGDLARAIELYQRLLTHDPYQEGVHRAVMHCYYRLGDRAAAIRQYQICVRILQTELGLNPARERNSFTGESPPERQIDGLKGAGCPTGRPFLFPCSGPHLRLIRLVNKAEKGVSH